MLHLEALQLHNNNIKSSEPCVNDSFLIDSTQQIKKRENGIIVTCRTSVVWNLSAIRNTKCQWKGINYKNCVKSAYDRLSAIDYKKLYYGLLCEKADPLSK